jgi:hypothetical protein
MAQQPPVAGEQDDAEAQEIERYEQDLAAYLQKRIKPGLNRGAIPLLSRSIAREVAHWDTFNDEDSDDEDADDDDGGEESDVEVDLYGLQSELGEEWIVSLSVHGDDAWLSAEKEDGSQRLKAPDADTLTEAVKLLDQGDEQPD